MDTEKKHNRRQFVKRAAIVGGAIAVAGCTDIVSDEVDISVDSDTNSGGGDSGGEISIGGTVEGTLGRDSPISPHRSKFAVPYTFEVPNQQRVKISHESPAFDTYVIITDEDDNVLQHNQGTSSDPDDDPPRDDSLLMPLLSPDETYTVWAAMDGRPLDSYDFTLSVDGPSALTEDAIDLPFGESITTDSSAAVPNPNQETTLGYTLRVPYRVEITEETRIGFEASVSGLIVTDDKIRSVTEAETRPTGNYSLTVDGVNIVRNEFTFTGELKDKGIITWSDAGEMTLSPGEYFFWVRPGETLRVTSEPIAIEDRIQEADHIPIGETITDELKQEPPREPLDYLYANPYTFDAGAGQLFVIEVSEQEFNEPGLVLTDTEENIINAELREGIDGSLQMVGDIPEDGRYVIWVRAHRLPGGGVTGEFDLSLMEVDLPEQTQTIAVGETVTGEITDESPRDSANHNLAIPYLIENREGIRTNIKLQSEEFEPELVLTDGTGGERTRSGESEITLPAHLEGLAVIWAGSEKGFKTGEFTLSIEAADI